MREHRYFFGIPLTEKDCLGWALLNDPFEIIKNRGTIEVRESDWFEEREPIFHFACLLAAIARCAECFDRIEPVYESGMCDGGPGLGPEPGQVALRDRHSSRIAEIHAALNGLFSILPAIVEKCLEEKQDGDSDPRWAGEIFAWLMEFYATACSYWSGFTRYKGRIDDILNSPVFVRARELDTMALPQTEQCYLRDVSNELFKLKFSWKHRPDYRR